MEIDQVLALFDQEQRRDVHFSDVRREVTPTVVRQVGLDYPESVIIYSWLTPDNVEAAIREEIAYFANLGYDFEWKVYEHDSPSDLKDRLLAHGFEAEEPEALVILDIETAPSALWQPITHNVRRITDPNQLGDVATMQEEVWQEDFSVLTARLADDLRHHPDDLSVYVAYIDGIATSSA